jgi:hypothetical protein
VGAPREGYDDAVARHLAEHRVAGRDRRRAYLRMSGHVVFWMACGLALMGLGIRSESWEMGQLLWRAGQLVWVGGVTFALLRAYRQGVERGDW